MTSKNLFIVFSLAVGIFALWYFFGQNDEKANKKNNKSNRKYSH